MAGRAPRALSAEERLIATERFAKNWGHNLKRGIVDCDRQRRRRTQYRGVRPPSLVLTRAQISSKIDYLRSLKDTVTMDRLMPGRRGARGKSSLP